MKPKMKSKKAQYSDAFVIMVAVIVYLIVYSVFYLIFSSTGLTIEDQIVSAKISSDKDFIVRQYLKMPVKIDNKTRIVSDLIFEYAESNNTKNNSKNIKLQEITEKIMQPYSDIYWRILVYDISEGSDGNENKKIFADISNKNKRAPFNLPEPAQVQIPHPDVGKYRKVYAYLYMEDND